jgi:hypothetical protein
MQNFIAWFKSQWPQLLAVVVLGAGVGVATHVGGCKPPTPAQTAKAEADLCKARAAYKLVAAAAGGALDPAPGSPRATLEAAEDALCLGAAK